MKFNNWTVALAALGVVSLASAAKAEEKASPVMTALSSTTISGYVDTSAEWNPNGNAGNQNLPPYKFNSPSKADGFNLDVIQLTISKPLDESDWAAGYRADLWFGPDANVLGTTSTGVNTSDFGIRQAYVALRAPIGTGLDLKMGVFDSIIGYESIEAGNDPNFTRSYGHSIEPQTHTGVLASYRFCDAFSASAGVADTVSSTINGRAQNGSSGVVGGPFAGFWNNLYNAAGVTPSDAAGFNAKAESYKTYMGSIALTAPDSMGFLSGSTLYGGIVNGYNSSVWGSGLGSDQTSYYVGATVATPVTGLRLGTAFDYLNYSQMSRDTAIGKVELNPYAWALAGYVSYQATEKLSFHERVEYTQEKFDLTVDGTQPDNQHEAKIFALTSTVQYDLWKNVISRLEFRWDRSVNGNNMFQGNTAGDPTRHNAFMLAANIIYKF
jgi:Putative beta-barrel porin-2, OmpL-like. bbp2